MPKLGVIPEIKNLMNHEDFGPNNWARRRKVIHLSLLLIGLLVSAVTIVTCIAVLYQTFYAKETINYDNGLLDLLSGLAWSATAAAVSLIGSYVFGAAWDSSSYRDALTTMATKKMANPTVEPQSAEEDVSVEETENEPTDQTGYPDASGLAPTRLW